MHLPPMFEIGVDPAQKILYLDVFFADEPSGEVKTALLAAMPSPLQASGHWVGPFLHAGTDEWPDIEDEDWPAFWGDVERWIAACATAAPVLFVTASAPLEVAGYAEAKAKGIASVHDVLVPHLTSLYARGVGLGDDAILFSNIAWEIAWTAAGRSDRTSVKLNDRARGNLTALAEAALRREPESKNWREDVLDAAAPLPS